MQASAPPSEPASIDTLPFELLEEIFSHCCCNDNFAPLTLRQVVWRWQYTVDHSPRLWQTISLSDKFSDYKLVGRQAEHWARRAYPSKYDIQLVAQELDNILPLLAPLVPSLDRWKSLRLNDHDAIPLGDLSLSTSTLNTLRLYLRDAEATEAADENPSSRITFKTIYNHKDDGTPPTPEPALDIALFNLPSSACLPSLHFSRITIAELGGSAAHSRPRQILEFLLACPNLESFRFNGWPTDGPDTEDLPSVRLPFLTNLHLKNTCSVRAILSHLDVPSLECLRLVHTNVDFPLKTDHHDEGDSDDEAQDYSQSPWSDHATGMGLRKLIKKCNPPIRVLDMDFCDMRTKDFRFVFERLKTLQNFRIVGSDMSNNVVNLLKPRHHTPATTVEGEDLSPGTKTTLLLPSLHTLRLHSCQRLSGSAIVDALRDRVSWTDEHTPQATLTTISVLACVGMTAWDQHLLTSEFGERIRVQL